MQQIAVCGHIILQKANGTANKFEFYKILKKSPALTETESLFVFAWQDIFISAETFSNSFFVMYEVALDDKLME